MTRELVRTAPLVLITSPDPYKLQALLRRERERRALLVRVPMAEVAPGVWGAYVSQFRPLRRPWVVPAAVTGGVVAVGALSWWLVSMAVTVLAGIGVTTLAGFGAILVGVWLASRRRGGGGCTLTVTHRHH